MKSNNQSILIKVIKNVIGLENIGKIEYYLNPNLKDVFGGAFNGQQIRQSIFLDLISSLTINSIIETGTFRGSTTVFFAETNLPVCTVEINKRYYGYSKMRLKKFSNVKLINDNSINFLRNISKKDLFPKSNIFFYLDAHGSGANLPLRDEVDLIFSKFTYSVVMIDDFEVPVKNYGYDTRLGHKLNLDLLENLIKKYHLTSYFPLKDSEEETGSKRGMVLLCKDDKVCAILEKNTNLQKYQL